MLLDSSWIGDRFPALGDEVALFDNAGGSVPVAGVVEAVRRYLAEDMVQLGASYRRSERASARVRAAYPAAAALVGGRPEGVVFGASTTTNLYVIARAFASLVGPGDEVVVTDLDHEANRGAWCRLAETQGATLRTWRAEEGLLTLAGLDAVLSDRTKVVAFTHCSNVVGALHDAAAFCARIRRAGAKSVVDGVAFAPHRRVDVAAVDADVYALSLYKVYGPHLGLCYLRPSLIAELDNQNHFFLDGEGSYQLMPGNVSHELAAGIPAVVDYLRALDRHHGGPGTLEGAFERIAAHESTLVEPLIDFLVDHPRVRLVGPATADASRRVPTVAFTVSGLASRELPRALDPRGLAIRYGHFYAYRAMEAFGLDPEDGIVRVSMVHYNRLDEVRRLVEALDAAIPR